MNNYLKNIWEWITTFPRPWRNVVISGGVLSKGGTVFVGKGITVTINGPICSEGHVYLEAESK